MAEQSHFRFLKQRSSKSAHRVSSLLLKGIRIHDPPPLSFQAWINL